MLANKLNPKIFEKDVEMKAIRDGYGDGLLIAGEANPDIVVLCADLTESTRSQKFAEKFPKRFFELGVAEQNLAAVAAGLGVSGKIPFISSYATFSPGRNWEQIRTTIAYNDSNVKIAGHHAGIMTGPDGATHEATEDVAIMRTLPNMRVFVPCDWIEAKKATIAAAKLWGPTYIRFAREKSPVVTTEKTPFTPGKAEILWQSKKPQALIVASGVLVHNALLAARELENEKIGTVVLNLHTIKPIDEEKIASLAQKCGAAVSVEEHQIYGGIGSAVAEVLAKNHPVPQEFIGMQDTFGESGNPWDLVKKYGMDAKDIRHAVKKVLRRK
ncbi:MAG: transketolase family protein [Candidatus Harrisonbacteria bacterium]|nr:transketolase family protein [Candidatus Harrisonbacteria bacterium]